MPDVTRDDDQTVRDRCGRDECIDRRDRFPLHTCAPTDFAPRLGDDAIHAQYTPGETRVKICQRLLELRAFSAIRASDLDPLTNLSQREDAEIEALLVTLVDPSPERDARSRLDEVGYDVCVK